MNKTRRRKARARRRARQGLTANIAPVKKAPAPSSRVKTTTWGSIGMTFQTGPRGFADGPVVKGPDREGPDPFAQETKTGKRKRPGGLHPARGRGKR